MADYLIRRSAPVPPAALEADMTFYLIVLVTVLNHIIFGTLSTALGMVPVFWFDALMLAGGGWLMHQDARAARNRPRG